MLVEPIKEDSNLVLEIIELRGLLVLPPILFLESDGMFGYELLKCYDSRHGELVMHSYFLIEFGPKLCFQVCNINL